MERKNDVTSKEQSNVASSTARNMRVLCRGRQEGRDRGKGRRKNLEKTVGEKQKKES